MSFDLLAPHYRWMEFLLAGGKLQRCRVRWLDAVMDCRRVLIVGEGNGRFLVEAGAKLPRAHFTVVDGSAGMLSRARARWIRAGFAPDRAQFIHAKLPDWTRSGPPYDLVVTHFFLDCFPPVEMGQVVQHLAECATPKAKWLLADFQEPDHGLARWRARWILWTAYTFFRLTTGLAAREVASPDATLQQAGFCLRERHTTDWGLLHSDSWERCSLP